MGRDGGAGGDIKLLGALRVQAFVCKRNKTNSAPLSLVVVSVKCRLRDML